MNATHTTAHTANKQASQLAGYLHSLPFFKELPEKLLALFQEMGRKETYRKGEMILMHGDPAKYFYLVMEGWVKLYRETLDGNEAVIDVLTTNHIFGETTVFNGKKYGWSAQAVENTSLLLWPTSLLEEQVQHYPQLAVNLLRSLTYYRAERDREIEHLKTQTAPQRIGCFLLRFCPNDWSVGEEISINLPYDKSLLALRLGMKSETFSRALNILKKDTGLKITGATVTITNINKLSEFCCHTCSNEFPCEDLEGNKGQKRKGCS